MVVAVAALRFSFLSFLRARAANRGLAVLLLEVQVVGDLHEGRRHVRFDFR